MKIKMTDPDVIWSFYEAIGCLGSIGRYGSSPSDKPNWKPHMTWTISRKDVIFELVTAFYPHMGQRRQAKFKEFMSWYLK